MYDRNSPIRVASLIGGILGCAAWITFRAIGVIPDPFGDPGNAGDDFVFGRAYVQYDAGNVDKKRPMGATRRAFSGSWGTGIAGADCRGY